MGRSVCPVAVVGACAACAACAGAADERHCGFTSKLIRNGLVLTCSKSTGNRVSAPLVSFFIQPGNPIPALMIFTAFQAFRASIWKWWRIFVFGSDHNLQTMNIRVLEWARNGFFLALFHRQCLFLGGRFVYHFTPIILGIVAIKLWSCYINMVKNWAL